jgi:hypothetical protein
VELVQHYHDNTKKLIKTEEGERVKGRLFRLAKKGEKADTQIMNAETFEVLALIAAPKGAYQALIEAEEDEQILEALDAAVEDTTDTTDTTDKGVASEPTDAAESVADAASGETDEGQDDMAKKKKTYKKVAKKKVAKKKVAVKAADAVETSSGQAGPPLQITKVNLKESKVIEQLNHGSEPQKISEIAKCFKGKSKAQANSWVRNSLRRLVRGGLVKQVQRGTYTLTAKGKKFEASA